MKKGDLQPIQLFLGLWSDLGADPGGLAKLINIVIYKFNAECFIITGINFVINERIIYVRIGTFTLVCGFGFIWFPCLMAYQPLSYLPTPPLGQDMTQGQFLSGV